MRYFLSFSSLPIFLLTAALGASAFAHGSSNDEDAVAAKVQTPQAKGILPDNPLYALDLLLEDISDFFIFSDEGKAAGALARAQERLAEVVAMIEVGKAEHAQNTLARLEEKLDDALVRASRAKENNGKNADELLHRVADATLHHQEVLAEVYERVPEQAKDAIEHAIEASRRGYERSSSVLSKDAQEQLKQRADEIWEMARKRLQKGPGTFPTDMTPPLIPPPGTTPLPGGETKPEACILLYAPVCGSDGKTYSNDCFARLAGTGVAYKGECGSQVAPPLAPQPPPPPSQEPQTREFNITAAQWSFSPATITVKRGERVKFTITSIDVTHGFSIPEFNVNVQLVPNQSKTAEFVADKKGAFSFFCTVFCGSGHADMRGQLIVE